MFETKLIAVVTEKRNRDISTTWEVMKMQYNVENNVLWITDHRGKIVDFDLDEFNVEIKTKNNDLAERSYYV